MSDFLKQMEIKKAISRINVVRSVLPSRTEVLV